MKVLLTGASGFVGSHILDRLRAREIPTALLLRPASNRQFIAPHLSTVEVRQGSVLEAAGLEAALSGITHVIHCAGATKARSTAEFLEVNRDGTRNLVAAANQRREPLERFILISSLAAAGPATAAAPVREADPPRPVSDYGRSKLAGEVEVREGCRAPYVILRPPGVYGPRDAEFLRLFKAVRSHLRPRPVPARPLSVVYVKDLAEAVATCLTHPQAQNKTFFAASPELTDSRRLASEIAACLGTWTIPLPLPLPVLMAVCLAEELKSRVTRKASVVNWQKYAELRAPGWVCDPAQLERDTGYKCPTTLKQGLAETWNWYREQKWL